MPSLTLPVAARRLAWHRAAATADANPADDFAQETAGAAANLLVDALGHGPCRDWQYGTEIGLVCACQTVLDPPRRAA